MMAQGVPQILSDMDDDGNNSIENNILPFFESRHQITEYTYIRFSVIAHVFELTLTFFVVPYLFITKMSHVSPRIIIWTLLMAFRLLIFIPVESFLLAFVPEADAERFRKKMIYLFYLFGILVEYALGFLYFVWSGMHILNTSSDSMSARYFYIWNMGLICFNLGMMILATASVSIRTAIANRPTSERTMLSFRSERRIAISDKDRGQVHNSSKEKCCICMRAFEDSISENKIVVVTQCDHVFHRDCIEQWITASRRCPLCSSDICER